jgi:hypothetical protein
MALIPGTLPVGTKYPNDPQSLLDTFASFLTAPEAKKNRPTVSVYTSVDAATISARTDGLDETIFLNHSGTAATATLAFPSNTNSVTGQTLRVFSADIVTALTVSLPGGVTILGAALGSPNLAANETLAWQKVAANTWIRIQ